MAALKGRALQLKRGGSVVAGVRTKSASIGNTLIDTTTDDDDGIRKALTTFGQREISISVSGIRADAGLLTEALAADPTAKYTLEGHSWPLSGSWALTQYTETGEYQGAVTFEGELQSIDAQPALTSSIAASDDDAIENTSTNNVNLASTTVSFIADRANGLRFAGLAIPNGATIVGAHVQLSADGTPGNSDPLDVTWWGEDIDDAPAFTASASDISNRTKTTASVVWQPDGWTASARGPDQKTPDLKSIVQEIVDRGGWASGNALVLIGERTSGSGNRHGAAYDHATLEAALLHVVWST